MDGANDVHDEIRPELWGKGQQFYWADDAYDTIYNIDNYTVCYVYCGYFCV